MHQAIYDIEAGFVSSVAPVDYLDGAKRARMEIGEFIFNNYLERACIEEQLVLSELESDFSRYRDQSENYEKLFGLYEKLSDTERNIKIRKMLNVNQIIYRYDLLMTHLLLTLITSAYTTQWKNRLNNWDQKSI